MIGLDLVFLLSVDSRTQKSLNSCLKQILWDQLILSNFSTPLLISRASAFFLRNLRQKKTEVHLAFLMRKALFFLLVDSFLYLFSPCSLTFLFFGSKRGSWEESVIHYAFQEGLSPLLGVELSQFHMNLRTSQKSIFIFKVRRIIEAHWIRTYPLLGVERKKSIWTSGRVRNPYEPESMNKGWDRSATHSKGEAQRMISGLSFFRLLTERSRWLVYLSILSCSAVGLEDLKLKARERVPVRLQFPLK